MGKRFFDAAVSGILLVLALPLFAAVSLAVYEKFGAPVFFRQKRPGRRGKPFTLYKFRTMEERRDTTGRLLPDRSRLTALGQVLRAWSLDELPELFNVLKGDMSLVGPRPLLMHYLPLYNREQARRHEVRPGITGWAQINGRNAVSWEEKFKMDVWYADRRSFALDLKILLATLGKTLRREGIRQPGQATAEEFRGN